MKRLTIGILAHVDAGKTTLSEALLYETGAIRSMGRVDHGDAHLDTDAMEKARGITIFSKMARFAYGDAEYVLLDTPGHADFTAEMERTLSVLDYAILVISGCESQRQGRITFSFAGKISGCLHGLWGFLWECAYERSRQGTYRPVQ